MLGYIKSFKNDYYPIELCILKKSQRFNQFDYNHNDFIHYPVFLRCILLHFIEFKFIKQGTTLIAMHIYGCMYEAILILYYV